MVHLRQRHLGLISVSLIKKSVYIALYCLLGIALLPRLSLASKVVRSVCAVVDRQSCGDCDHDTPALRGALATLETEKKRLETQKASSLQIELCRFKGWYALSVVHLTWPPSQSAVSEVESEQLQAMIQKEQMRLLARYPNNEAVLRTVIRYGYLSDEANFRHRTSLSNLNKTDAEAAFYAGYYGFQMKDLHWQSQLSRGMKLLRDAQAFRVYTSQLYEIRRFGRCDARSQQALSVLSDEQAKSWDGVEADATIMSPAMLAVASKYADEIKRLNCQAGPLEPEPTPLNHKAESKSESKPAQ